MARQMSATRRDGLSTFLLEMALDKARMKARLAAVLLDERTRRGLGDARRYPQPEMARLLGYSLRQYQRLEDADDPSLPGWDDLTEILAKLERPETDVFGSDNISDAPAPAVQPDPVAATGREGPAGLAAEVAAQRRLLEAIAAALGIDPDAYLGGDVEAHTAAPRSAP